MGPAKKRSARRMKRSRPETGVSQRSQDYYPPDLAIGVSYPHLHLPPPTAEEGVWHPAPAAVTLGNWASTAAAQQMVAAAWQSPTAGVRGNGEGHFAEDSLTRAGALAGFVPYDYQAMGSVPPPPPGLAYANSTGSFELAGSGQPYGLASNTNGNIFRPGSEKRGGAASSKAAADADRDTLSRVERASLMSPEYFPPIAVAADGSLACQHLPLDSAHAPPQHPRSHSHSQPSGVCDDAHDRADRGPGVCKSGRGRKRPSRPPKANKGDRRALAMSPEQEAYQAYLASLETAARASGVKKKPKMTRSERKAQGHRQKDPHQTYLTELDASAANTNGDRNGDTNSSEWWFEEGDTTQQQRSEWPQASPATSPRSKRRHAAASAAAAAAIVRETSTPTRADAGAAAGGFGKGDTRPWGRMRETEEGRGLSSAAVGSSSRDAEIDPPVWGAPDDYAEHGDGWQGWEGEGGGGRRRGWEGSDGARVRYGGTGDGHDHGAGGVSLPLEAAPLGRASELGLREAGTAPWPVQHATQEEPWRGRRQPTGGEPAPPPVYQWDQSGGGPWHQQPGNPWQRGGDVSWPGDAAAQAPGVLDGSAADPQQCEVRDAEEATAAAFAVRDEVAARLGSANSSTQSPQNADWRQVAPEGLTVGREGEGQMPTEPPDLATVRKSARWGSRWGPVIAGDTSEAPVAWPATGDPQMEERLWAKLQKSARPASPSPSPLLPPLPPPLPDAAPEEWPPTPAAGVALESPPELGQSAPSLGVSARIASASPRPAVVAASADLPGSSDPVRGSVELRGATVVRGAGNGVKAGKQDAGRKRAALRKWRSAAYEHALVLVGAANLPRKTCASIAKMPGAMWVDRHELAERSSLPLEVKASLAKALADRMPACGSCDDNETGRDHVLLMTFSSAEHKTAAVDQLAELAVDTTDFANSLGLQVEYARAVPPPPCMPPSPPPPDVGQVAGLSVDATDLDNSPGLEAEHSCEVPPPPPPPGPPPPQERTVKQLAELAADTMDVENPTDLQKEHACEPRPPPPPNPAVPDIPTAVAMEIPPPPAESPKVAEATKESSSAIPRARPLGKPSALSGRLAEARVKVLKALGAERAIAAAAKARAEAKEAKSAKGRDGGKKAGAKKTAQAAAAGKVGKVSGTVKGGAAAAASKRAKVGSPSSPGVPADRSTSALKGSERAGSSTAAGKTSAGDVKSKVKVKAKTKVKVTAKGKPAAEEAPLRPVDAPVAPPASRASGASPAPCADASAKPSPAPRPSRPGQPGSDKPATDPSGRKQVAAAGGAPASLSSSPVPPARRTPSPVPPARRTPSPVPPARRTPSPVPPHFAVQKASVGQSVSAAAPRTAPTPARALSPTRRGIGISSGIGGAGPAAQAGAGAADRVLPPLKALGKRLVVLRPSGPPDLTVRKWDYGFSGPYFRLLDRDVKTGEPLPCDPSKNTSYVGVIPPPEVILAGLREHGKQRRSAVAMADMLAGAGAAAAAAANGDAPTRSNSSGSSSVDAGESTDLSAPAPRTAPPPRQQQQRAASMVGKQALLATVPSAVASAAAARLEGRVLTERGIGGAIQEGVAGGTESTREVAAGEAGRALRGNLGSRIRQAEDELRLLQEMKIPRVMEALADVSQQRRKLEVIAASVAVKRAAAHARLAQDSRDAASALMGELNARRQASQQQKQKQQQQQQKQSRFLHAGVDEGISGADGPISRKISSLPSPSCTAAAILSPPAAATVAATAPEAALARVAPKRSPAADGGQVADRVGPLAGRPGKGGGEARDPRVRHAAQKARVGSLVK